MQWYAHTNSTFETGFSAMLTSNSPPGDFPSDRTACKCKVFCAAAERGVQYRCIVVEVKANPSRLGRRAKMIVR